MCAEAVFLDAGGVLVLPDFDVIRDAVAVSLDDEVLTRAHYAGMRGVDLAEKFSWWNYNHAFCEVCGLGEDAYEPLNRAYVDMEWHLPIADSMDALPDLEAHYAVAVVSNSDGTVTDILRRRGVKIPTIIDSHHVGVAKPDPAIFELAIQEVGVAADDVVHVGDSVRFDVDGARSAGIRPLHFDPLHVCDDSTHDHIASLRELL
jgi:putative hydrolase of the HAD superfamily